MAISNATIEELASAPKKTTTDEGTVEERSIADVIEGDRYSATKTAGDAVPWGLRVARTQPRGTV